jgi:hypothetical protein
MHMILTLIPAFICGALDGLCNPFRVPGVCFLHLQLAFLVALLVYRATCVSWCASFVLDCTRFLHLSHVLDIIL